MLNGHGDDIYNYEGIRMNFSSNIYAHADLSGLEAHLCRHIDLVRSYPEPSPRSLEKMIAQRCGVSPDEVMVTSGATDAIYLIAQAFRFVHAVAPQQPLSSLTFKVFPPTFSEYEDACRVFGYQESDDAALCWLCNPNNPTGEVFPFSHIEGLASKHALLVLDQSYEDYTLAPMLSAKTAVSMGNVLQIHSMTKQYAIPGLRPSVPFAPTSVPGQSTLSPLRVLNICCASILPLSLLSQPTSKKPSASAPLSPPLLASVYPTPPILPPPPSSFAPSIPTLLQNSKPTWSKNTAS